MSHVLQVEHCFVKSQKVLQNYQGFKGFATQIGQLSVCEYILVE
jgi:hypothetical protein